MATESRAASTLRIATWAAEECDRQRSGELSVAWMVAGWKYAIEQNGPPDEEDIIHLGAVVEPRRAATGYRQVNVRVGWSVKGPWQRVPAAMAQLVAEVGKIPADDWFRQYEEIHPFADGNGRTGSILWNWLGGTLHQPLAPPDFWGDVK